MFASTSRKTLLLVCGSLAVIALWSIRLSGGPGPSKTLQRDIAKDIRRQIEEDRRSRHVARDVPLRVSQEPPVHENAPVLEAFDAGRFAADWVYRAKLSEFVRTRDLGENPVFETEEAMTLRRELEARGVSGRDLTVYLRWAVEEAVMNTFLKGMEAKAFSKMKQFIGDKEPDFLRGSIDEFCYRDTKQDADRYQMEAVKTFSALTGISDDKFFETLFQLKLAIDDFPSLEGPLVAFSPQSYPR